MRTVVSFVDTVNVCWFQVVVLNVIVELAGGQLGKPTLILVFAREHLVWKVTRLFRKHLPHFAKSAIQGLRGVSEVK